MSSRLVLSQFFSSAMPLSKVVGAHVSTISFAVFFAKANDVGFTMSRSYPQFRGVECRPVVGYMSHLRDRMISTRSWVVSFLVRPSSESVLDNAANLPEEENKYE